MVLTKKKKKQRTRIYFIASSVLLVVLGYSIANNSSPHKPAASFSFVQTSAFLNSIKNLKESSAEPNIPEVRSKLAFRSIQYFEDALHEKKNTGIFNAGSPIFLSMNLGGFGTKDQIIAGAIDLKVTNSEGKVIATKNGFAEFSQKYNKDKNVLINGELKFNDPDIYLLSFKVRDFFSKKSIEHTERLLVRLTPPQPEANH